MVDLEKLNEDGFLDWLAGFVAGEGCFRSFINTTGGPTPEFQVGLRADDSAILEVIREKLGVGNIYINRMDNCKVPNASPALRFRVIRKDELSVLIAIFDAHSLRAKKQQDYEIWRKMVIEKQKPYEYQDKQRLMVLHHQLKAIKKYEYDEDEWEWEEPSHEQLEFEVLG